jgi:GntR family transcriptional regulator
MLPTENELCAMFGVSRITVKRAMRQLALDGFVTRRRGLGTFAIEATVGTPRRNALDDLLQSVQAIGASTDMRRIAHGQTRATIEVAEQLGCKPGALVYRIDQIRMSGAEPIAFIQAYLPTWVAARMRDKESSRLPVLAQVVNAGIAVDRAEQAIGATLADPTAASHLEVEVGLPLIRLTRRVLTTDMKPVEWLMALYRGDRYEYRTTLTRDGLAGGRNEPISAPRRTKTSRARRVTHA